MAPLQHYQLSDHNGKRVLVVDDNMTNRAILKNQLETWKLQPVLANSGNEALLVLAADNSFDLVLTDMQMPYMDGNELAASIKQLYPHIPVLLLSSAGDELNKSHRHLFHAVLNKPVKQHLLGKTILSAFSELRNNRQEEKTVQEKLPGDFAVRHPMNILIAEDNLINQQVILHILTRLGYEPGMVENGLEAVAQQQEKNYDLILMDMQMPEMDGIDATQRIRSQPVNQPVIIALTANTMQGDEEICLQAGMDDYLSKPLKLEDLVAKLEKWYQPGIGNTNATAV